MWWQLAVAAWLPCGTVARVKSVPNLRDLAFLSGRAVERGLPLVFPPAEFWLCSKSLWRQSQSRHAAEIFRKHTGVNNTVVDKVHSRGVAEGW